MSNLKVSGCPALSAHACSEIGLKWFLFALHDPGALDFMSILDFLGDFVSSNTGETSKPELKPFLTILGTRMRATYCILANSYVALIARAPRIK
jgi:hypothetical protein